MNSTKNGVATGLLWIFLFCSITVANAHHSFAIYDFETEIPFEGTIHTLNFKNPHVSLTLSQIGDDGKERIVKFIEGAPANMMVRQGLKPDMIKVGTKLTIVGSPLKDDDTQFFIRKVILENGDEWSW